MKPLKIIVFSTILFHSLGMSPNSIIFNNTYTVRGNLAFAQEEQKNDSQAEKPKKEEETSKKEKGEQKKKSTEKETEKIKLPKQNNIINPETFRMMEMI